MKNRLKNKIFLGFLALSLVLASSLHSCSDILNMAPDGKISLDDVFADSEKIASYLNTCYAYIPSAGANWYFYNRGPVVWCDEAWDADVDVGAYASNMRWYKGDASPADHPILNQEGVLQDGNGNYWNRYWAAIRNCSYFLTHIETSTVVSAANKSRWKAEAHLLRAFYYAELLRFFACPLPIEREAYSYTADFSTTTRSSYYDVAKFIIEDCDEALKSAELPWRIATNAEAYRYHKGIAEAIKSRMSVYMASPLYNDGQNHWEEAYQINKTALENLVTNGYELYNQINFAAVWKSADAFLPNDEAALFNEYFCNDMVFSSNPMDRETIYHTKDDQGIIWGFDGIGSQAGYRTSTCPSQELVDCFETTNGKTVLNLEKPYTDEITHLYPNLNADNELYSEQTPYVNRDPRFYASIYYDGCYRKAYWSFPETKEDKDNPSSNPGYRTRRVSTWIGEPHTGIDPVRRSATRTGYYERKFLHPNTGNEVVSSSQDAKCKTFRLAEVILNFAEAAAEAGHLDEAWAAVNQIRNRVGMPNLPDALKGDKNGLILRIHNERRVELALEGFRYFDVRRWTAPEGDLEKTDRWITAARITISGAAAPYTYTFARGPVSVERLCYSQKWLRFPVPMNDVNIMKALTGEDWQNPGW
ncbi:MAG: RagB/SusD family nutrient uptake outer membrane protein [Tannerella sp.]|nr:RagB/SusD family nutrient uptake outer membrane protein [Tannerella sp.]